jgi:hypothetical protein
LKRLVVQSCPFELIYDALSVQLTKYYIHLPVASGEAVEEPAIFAIFVAVEFSSLIFRSSAFSLQTEPATEAPRMVRLLMFQRLCLPEKALDFLS